MTMYEIEGELLHRAGTTAEWAAHKRVLRKGEAGYIDLGLPTQVERIGVGIEQPDGTVVGPTFDQLPDITFGSSSSGSIAMSLPAHQRIPATGSPVPVALSATGGVEPIIPYSTSGTVLESEAIGSQISTMGAAPYDQEYVQLIYVAKYNRTYMAVATTTGTVTIYSGIKDTLTNYTWRVESSVSISARAISMAYDAQLDTLVLVTNTTSGTIIIGRITLQSDGTAAYDIAHQTTVLDGMSAVITSATRIAIAPLNNGRYILSYTATGGSFIRPVTAMMDGSFQVKSGIIRNPQNSSVYMTAADTVAVIAYVDASALVGITAKVNALGELVVVHDAVVYIDGEGSLGTATGVSLLWDAERRLVYALTARATGSVVRIATCGVAASGGLYTLGRTTIYTGVVPGRLRLWKYRGTVYAGVDFGTSGISLLRVSPPTDRTANSTAAVSAYATSEVIGAGATASSDFYTPCTASPEDMLFVRRYSDGVYVIAYSPIQASGNVDSFIGYANITSTVEVGQEVPTLLTGSVVPNLLDLTPNAMYYMTPQGQLNTSGKGRRIGLAIDTTNLYLTGL